MAPNSGIVTARSFGREHRRPQQTEQPTVTEQLVSTQTEGIRARRGLTLKQKGGIMTEAYEIAEEIVLTYAKARSKHAPMRGPHEGYAIILEELDELWDEVKAWQPNDVTAMDDYTANMKRMRKEALHVAAMALAFLLEVAL